ncbi:YcxB family protein [Blastopirellula marina]|uniref:Uncharacterized protein n=1 Tax=Blastopirellula marina DSM 3645 TaxID=314230 RepID=A3ZLB4_9BACT|nr:YcxB family protein [Blastopirellula marina]EAQ82547.1 hypothetical protein DSM3645_09117 [Blastopirellula marina DSM 3645]
MNHPASDNPFQSPPAPPSDMLPTDEVITVEGVLSPKDLAAAYKLYCINGRTIGWMVAVTIAGFFLYRAAKLEVWGMLLLLILASSITIFWLGMYWLSYFLNPFWRAKRLLLQEVPQRSQIVFSESGVQFDSSAKTVLYVWSQFSQLLAGRKMLVLILKTGELLMIPSHFSTSEADFRQMRKKIAARLSLSEDFDAKISPDDQKEISFATSDSGEIAGEGYLQPNEYFIAQRQVFQNQFLLTVSFGVAACGAGAYFLWVAFFVLPYQGVGIFNPQPETSVVGAGVSFLLAIASFFLLRHRIGQSRRVYQDEFCGRLIRWLFNEQSLTCRTNHSRQTYDWKNITGAIEKGNQLILIHLNHHPLSLPRRFFASDEDWRQVVEWAQRSE